MGMMFKSPLSGTQHDLKKVARVPDRRLQLLFLKNNILPIDMYISTDNNNRQIIVMLFNKSETSQSYNEWIRNKPQKGGEIDV